MNIHAHLAFDGDCEAAFKFYEQCLGGKITFMMKYGESPMADQFPPEWSNRILHGTLTVGDAIVTGGDAGPEGYEKPRGFCVSIGIQSLPDATRIFQALSENGTIQIPFEQTFWALGFGMLTDQFGIPWVINCEQSS